MPPEKLRVTTIAIDEARLDWLHNTAKINVMSASELVRAMIDQAIKRGQYEFEPSAEPVVEEPPKEKRRPKTLKQSVGRKK